MSTSGRPRRWRATAAVIASLVLGGAVWFAAGPNGNAHNLREFAGEATRRQSTAMPRVAAAAARLTASVASRNVVDHGPDDVQVCGGAWVRTGPDGEIDQVDYERAIHLPQTRAEIVARLNAAPDDLSRLAGLLVATASRGELHRGALIGLPAACEGDACAAMQAAEVDVEQAREAVARVAVASTDPTVYGLALKVCRDSREGTCPLLSAQQWARLDPGNASPWLKILADARAGSNEAAQVEALHRIASAERNDAREFALTGAVMKVVPVADSEADASFATANVALGLDMAWVGGNHQPLLKLCSTDALRDANRAQVCAGVAATLTDRSDTLIDRSIGSALGKRLGWPVERVESARVELNAYSAARLREMEEPVTPASCIPTRRLLHQLRRMAAAGEVGAIREWLALSSKRPDDLLREDHARQQRQPAANEAAPSTSGVAAAR